MLGIVPAAGAGTRIQPLAFSKELLPVGSRLDEDGVERSKAVSEYLIERMIRAGADQICFVISPEKTDIIPYYARHPGARRCGGRALGVPAGEQYHDIGTLDGYRAAVASLAAQRAEVAA